MKRDTVPFPLHFSCWIVHEVIFPLTSKCVEKQSLVLISYPNYLYFPLHYLLNHQRRPHSQNHCQDDLSKSKSDVGKNRLHEKLRNFSVYKAPGQKPCGQLGTWIRVCTQWIREIKSDVRILQQGCLCFRNDRAPTRLQK